MKNEKIRKRNKTLTQEPLQENDGWSTNNIKRDVFYEE